MAQQFLTTMNCLNDRAIYRTDKEYKEEFGKDVNIQSIIEKPEIYPLTRCEGDNRQLLYPEYRN